MKANVYVKSKSPPTFINNGQNLKGLRWSLLPYTDQGWMENIPLYAAETHFHQYTKADQHFSGHLQSFLHSLQLFVSLHRNPTE